MKDLYDLGTEEYLEHIPQEITEEIEKYVEDVVFRNERYLFITKRGKKYYGYCTHCHDEIQVNMCKGQNMQGICPSCGSRCTIKYAGYSRKYMWDRGCFVRFDKSAYDPEAITARGYYVERDYSGDYKDVKTQYYLRAVYVFKPGCKSVMLDRWHYIRDGEVRYSGWEKRKSVFDFKSVSYGFLKGNTDGQSLQDAIEDTVYKYMPFEQYCFGDLLKIVDLYSKYPLVTEHLSKLKLTGIIDAKLYGWNTFSAVNWKGKDIYKALKINKQDLNIIRNSGVKITPLFLRLYQAQKKDGSKLKPLEIKSIEYRIDYCGCDFLKLLKYGKVKKLYNYLKQQEDTKRLQSYFNIISTYRDYLADCKKLNMNLNDERVLFPKDLIRAHANTIKQVKYTEDKELNEKIEKRIESLRQKYSFEFNGLFIRPAKDSLELVDEGKILHHCVAGYADRYAKGTTNILVIREKNKPYEPYYTMEINNKGKIVQVRGKYNSSPDESVEKFIEAFKAEKLEDNKVKLTA